MLDGRALVSLPATPRSIIYYQKYFILENNDL